jgi:thymidylate synthase
MGDTHVYLNHVEPLKEQLQRTPRDFPTLHFKRKVDNIEDFTFEDFEIRDYNPYPKINMEMAV